MPSVAQSVLLAAGGMGAASAAQPIPLPSLNVQRGSITTSGLSSGGFMSVQMHVAFSELFSGVGVFAGGPYYCALGTFRCGLCFCLCVVALYF